MKDLRDYQIKNANECTEKLSKYFIAMAKKIKVNTIEVNEIKTIITNNKSKSNKEKYLELIKINPDANKKEIAELLGVSLRTLFRYDKQ